MSVYSALTPITGYPVTATDKAVVETRDDVFTRPFKELTKKKPSPTLKCEVSEFIFLKKKDRELSCHLK